MKRIIITLVFLLTLFLINTASIFAAGPGDRCNTNPRIGASPSPVPTRTDCEAGLFCKLDNPNRPNDGGTCQEAKIGVGTPEKGFATLGNAISNTLTIAFAVAVLVVLVMLILGAFEWITSGGDKEAVGKARGRIINAIIGLIVLALAFAISRVAAQFTGLDISNILIPAPDRNAPGF